MDRLGDFATLAVAVVVVVGGLAAWLKWVRPKWRVVTRFLGRIDETINGRDPVHDSYGRVTAPAIPPLAEQQSTLQQQMGELTAAVSTLVSHREEIESIRVDHELTKARVSKLEAAAVERIVTRAESAAGWRAIEAVAKDEDPA